MKKSKAIRRPPRVRRAKPLLVAAAGAALLVAGCGDNSCANGTCADMPVGVPVIGDLGIPPTHD